MVVYCSPSESAGDPILLIPLYFPFPLKASGVLVTFIEGIYGRRRVTAYRQTIRSLVCHPIPYEKIIFSKHTSNKKSKINLKQTDCDDNIFYIF